MYFPYLRGKQFELIALRELSERMGESGSIHPVIEPVKSTVTTLDTTIDFLKDHDVPFTGGISGPDQLKANFKMHCIPFDNELWREDNYQEFPGARMDAMAMKLKTYYENL